VGEKLVDSRLLYIIAFYGIRSHRQLLAVTVAQYSLKTGWEILMTSLTYHVVAFLKAKENEVYFDRYNNFNPFKLKG
jgi:uncharacterized PurR-regulated membrane protein YhhQ (DUF165 family)